MKAEPPTNVPVASDAPETQSDPLLGRDVSTLTFKKWLVILFLLGLVVRVGFFLEHAHSPSFGVLTLDQKYYDTVARMLLSGEDLHQLHGFRPLLYPMYLALCYQLGGSRGVDLAIFGQHLLGIGTGILVALLGARVFRHRLSGVIGGGLFLLAPVPLYFEGELLIEPGYTFLICLGLLLVLRAADGEGWKSAGFWLCSGGLTVLISQARANILVFLAVYPLFAAWRWWQVRRPAAGLPLVGLAGALAMAIPWGWVNMKQSDHFHLMPNAGGVNLYLGNKRTADGMVPEQGRRIAYGERYQDSVETWAREEYESAMRAQNREPDSDPMAISRYWTRRTLGEIEADPAGWMQLIAKKCWLTLWNAEIPNNKAFAFLQEEFLWLRWLPVRWVLLLMLACPGIWAAFKRGNRDALFVLLMYAGLYSAANVAFFICDRYRYPVWPVMATLAGGGLLAGLESIRRRQWRRALGLGAGMILLAALSLHNWFGAKLPSYARDFLFRSIAWYEKGHFPEALSDIEQSVELDPADATALHHRGNVLFALGRFAESKAAYEATLKLSPNEAGAWNNLGATLQAMHRTDEALQAYRRAMQCSPPSRNAFFGTAFIQVQSGQLDDATATLDLLDKQEKTPDAAALAIRSVIARRRGNLPEADALERQARSLDAEAVNWAMENVSGVHL